MSLAVHGVVFDLFDQSLDLMQQAGELLDVAAKMIEIAPAMRDFVHMACCCVHGRGMAEQTACMSRMMVAGTHLKIEIAYLALHPQGQCIEVAVVVGPGVARKGEPEDHGTG